MLLYTSIHPRQHIRHRLRLDIELSVRFKEYQLFGKGGRQNYLLSLALFTTHNLCQIIVGCREGGQWSSTLIKKYFIESIKGFKSILTSALFTITIFIYDPLLTQQKSCFYRLLILQIKVNFVHNQAMNLIFDRCILPITSRRTNFHSLTEGSSRLIAIERNHLWNVVLVVR